MTFQHSNVVSLTVFRRRADAKLVNDAASKNVNNVGTKWERSHFICTEMNSTMAA
jgi:hypothetical protein